MGKICVVAVLLVLGLGGCGGADSGTGTAGEKQDAPAAQSKPKPGSNVPEGGRTVVAKVFTKPQRGIPADVGQWMVDIGVAPGDDPAFTVSRVVAPSGNANFRLKNPQAVGHNLTIGEGEGGSIATPVIREGASWIRASLFVGQPLPFYCSVPGHREAGMEGTIEADPDLEAKDLKPF